MYAVSTVIAVFLAGLALGAVVAGRFGLGAARPILTYAVLELCIAVFGLGSPLLLDGTATRAAWFGLSSGLPDVAFNIVRSLFAFVLLCLPTMAMGASLPVLMQGFSGEREKIAESLYSWNVSGAVIGALATGFFLLPLIGLQATCWSATLLNLVAGAVVVLRYGASARSFDGTAHGADDGAIVESTPQAGRGKGSTEAAPQFSVVLIAAFFTGFIALTFQIGWVRLFQLLLGSSTYSNSAVVSLFIAGLALGAWAVSAWLRNFRQPILITSSALFLSAAYIVTSLYVSDELPWSFISLVQGLSGAFPNNEFAASMAARLLLVGFNVLIPSLLMGAALPSLLQAAALDDGSAAKKVGFVLGINSIGAIVGALLAGFVLLPLLATVVTSGIQTMLLLAAMGQIGLSLWLFMIWTRSFVSDKETRWIVDGIVIFVVVAVVADIAVFRPSWNTAIMSSGPSFYSVPDMKKLTHEGFLASLGVIEGSRKASPIVFYREGIDTTVSVGVDQRRNAVYLKNDGKVEAAIPFDPQASSVGTDMLTHVMLGALPPLLSSDLCSNGLVIGYGSGTTSGALLAAAPGVKLDIAELESAVYASNKYFSASNGNPLAPHYLLKGTVNPLVADGRLLLERQSKTYDAIICQPADPWVAGSSELFTEQFWQLAKSRLAPRGIMAQWIQLYSIEPRYFGVMTRTFLKVFPNAALFRTQRAGECVLLGGASAEMDLLRVENSVETEPLKKMLSIAGYSHGQIEADLVLDSKGLTALCDELARQTSDARFNTDDNMIIEFASARSSMTQEQRISENINLINRFSRSKTPVVSGGKEP